MSPSKMSLGAAMIAAIGMGPALATDAPPKVDTSQPTPVVYPPIAQRAGEEGTVVVRVYVTSDGAPFKADVVKSSGYPDLDTAAVETAANWHYLPALHDGDTVSDWDTVQVVYRLSDRVETTR
jgi:protein TonB